MKKHTRVTIWVGDKCSLSTSASVEENFSTDADLVVLLKEIISMLEAPTLEDKEIF